MTNRGKIGLGAQFIGLLLLGMNIGMTAKSGNDQLYLAPIGLTFVLLGLGIVLMERLKKKK